jgi:hypothetical protein
MKLHEATLGLLLFLPLLGTASCSTTPPEPDATWQGGELPAASNRVLWKVALLVLERQGYPLAGGVDPSSMVITTGWLNSLAPFSGEGFRRKAVVRMKPLGDGLWEVTVRVQRQVNQSLRPLDLRHADWEWTEDDVEAAQVLLQHIRSRLDPHERVISSSPGGA